MSLCIIPARGGSKRIPKKNIRNFHGKPIIAYSIEKALSSNLFKKVVVSTDDEEIASIAKEYGAEVPFLRPKELSDDFATSGDAVNYTVSELQKAGEEYRYICTIYATAPFLQTKYLIKGFERLKNSDAHMVFSATSMPFPIQRTFKITKEGRCQMFTPEHFTTRSQDLEEAYQDAGQFYIEDTHTPLTDLPFAKESIPLIIPRHLVQDIDTLEDWERAQYMYATLNQDKFDKWNSLKRRLDKKKKIINFYQGNIYFMSIGANIGHETHGKEKLFLRPVLVYKKLTKTTFLGIPLTSKEKNGSYFFKFSYKKDKTSIAMLNQMRVYDIRRSEYLSGKVSKNTLKNLEKKVIDFMKVTSSQGRGMPTKG